MKLDLVLPLIMKGKKVRLEEGLGSDAITLKEMNDKDDFEKFPWIEWERLKDRAVYFITVDNGVIIINLNKKRYC